MKHLPLILTINNIFMRSVLLLLQFFNRRYFMYDGLEHSCIEDDHIVNIFSFSKAYGMMGWRVGYVSKPLPSLPTAVSSLLHCYSCKGL